MNRTTLRLDPISIVLVVLLIAGAGIGGGFIGKGLTETPHYDITLIVNSQTADLSQVTIQESFQGTMVTEVEGADNSFRYVNVWSGHLTNVTVHFSTNESMVYISNSMTQKIEMIPDELVRKLMENVEISNVIMSNNTMKEFFKGRN